MLISSSGSRMGAPAGGVEPGERAAHVGKRLFHSWQWIIGVDLVLQVDVAPIPDGLELLKDRGDRDDTLAHDALTRGRRRIAQVLDVRSEEHTSELQSLAYLVCRLLLEKKKQARPSPEGRPLIAAP